MTETPNKLVIDCLTNTQTYIPLSAEEVAQRAIDDAAFIEAAAAREEAERIKSERRLEALTLLSEASGMSVDEITEALA